MNRRDFMTSLGVAAGTMLLPRWSWAAQLPRDLKITRIVGFDLTSYRPKVVGKNSHLDVHGCRGGDRMVRMFTNKGIEGLGNCWASEEDLSGLLGQRVADFYDSEPPKVTALGNGTMPLWDLAGKVLGKPVYELLGARGPEKVKAYDGSIYFVDLLPPHAHRYRDQFREEIDMALDRGHRAFKIKIGRGYKWMETEPGYERDLEVLRLIRDHAGPDVALGVDSNNGYTLERTKRLLQDLPDFGFAFMEEMFSEEVKECKTLKQFIEDGGWNTLVADGETQRDPEVFKPFIEAKALDVLQGDMNLFGIEGILKEAALAEPAGIQVAPHNWGSLVGYYMQLQMGRAIPNFYRAEQDPLYNAVLRADSYELKEGEATVPDTPGFGLTLDEEKFKSEADIRFDLKA